MHEKPKLRCTRDYSIFESHELNRELQEKPNTLASMARVGFMPSSPIQVERNGSGKLKVIRGHHRLDYAKRLNLPVWFVVDDSNVNIYELEGDSTQSWSMKNFAVARAHAGDPHCLAVIAFQKEHGLTITTAASLLGGESAGSNNKTKMLKAGTFKVAADLTHAHTVVSITNCCRAQKLRFATSAAFVSAVSLACRVPEFEPPVFIHRITINGGQMMQRSTVDSYLKEIEALYNYQAKGRRLALAFRAREVSKMRQIDFNAPRAKAGK